MVVNLLTTVSGYNYCGQCGCTPSSVSTPSVSETAVSESDTSDDDSDGEHGTYLDDAYARISDIDTTEPLHFEFENESEDDSDDDAYDEMTRTQNMCITTPTVNAFFEDSKIRFSKISCGSFHSLCITTDGACYTFGHNAFGNLGMDRRCYV